MIEIRNLSKTFHLKSGDVKALDDVSLDIDDGEIYGIIGYSGAGKSTLIRCINLLELPDEGNITVNGKRIIQTEQMDGIKKVTFIGKNELNTIRKKMGMIFQQFNLLDRHTVFDNVAFPLRRSELSKEQIREKVSELLELVELTDKASVYPSQLSGGQKQRVAIARALANDPDILLSDEATSALDPDATESILNLLKKLNSQLGLTIVLITHEMSVIKSICHKVAVIEEGNVVEEGNTYDIFARPQARITRRFVESLSSDEKLNDIVSLDDNLPEGYVQRLVRLTFLKESVEDAIISEISTRYNVKVNIILANIELLQDGPLGKMAAVIKGRTKDVELAIRHLKDCKVEVEDVANE